MSQTLTVIGDKCIIKTQDKMCETGEQVVGSKLFKNVIQRFVKSIEQKDSPLLGVFNDTKISEEGFTHLLTTLQLLREFPKEEVIGMYPPAASFLLDTELMNSFVEDLYNYWRAFKRFLICSPKNGVKEGQRVSRPYRLFNETVETLTHLVRAVYRDICENITGQHPQIYRQVCAGAQIALITAKSTTPYPEKYAVLEAVPVIRQVLLNPPLILHPSMNKRSGEFQKTEKNPFPALKINPEDWLCYPAKVGPLTVHIFFEKQFIDLGCSLANLFEISTAEEVSNIPDAICCYGVPEGFLSQHVLGPLTFCDDEENNILLGTIAGGKTRGYFGFLKKMVLTLHNVIMIKRRQFPYHGAMVNLSLRRTLKLVKAIKATVLLMGNTGTGKSELLEALRKLGEELIASMNIVADDMGSLSVVNDKVVGYGTEVGAFVRLDDLPLGYAFDQVDRSIIMGAGEVNARAVLPITTLADVLRGNEVDFILYANNHEEVDASHPIIERFCCLESALNVFRKGTSAAKGTTTSTGIGDAFYANIFGPPSYPEEYEKLARVHFQAALDAGVFVGQIRTRLGVPGYEQEGPKEAARALLELIKITETLRLSEMTRKKLTPSLLGRR